MQPWQLVLIGVAGWMNRKQQQLIDYLLEENRVLREQLGKQRLRFSDAQKKRLALKAKALGWRRLKEIASAATPQTLMNWYRTLIRGKYDGSKSKGPGRPSTAAEVKDLVLDWPKPIAGGAIQESRVLWRIWVMKSAVAPYGKFCWTPGWRRRRNAAKARRGRSF